MGSNKESLRLASMPKILATLLVRNKIYHYLPSRWRSSKQCAVIFVWPASVSDPGNHIWSWFAAKFVVSTAIVLHKNADHWHQLMNDKHVQIWPGNQAGLALACPSVAASFVRWASKYFQILWSFKLQIPVGWFVWLLGLPGNAVGPCKALRETCADLAELTGSDRLCQPTCTACRFRSFLVLDQPSRKFHTPARQSKGLGDNWWQSESSGWCNGWIAAWVRPRADEQTRPSLE